MIDIFVSQKIGIYLFNNNNILLKINIKQKSLVTIGLKTDFEF